MILISFDIDGTLEVGDPPGIVTMEMVRIAQEKGFLIGSCSDRPISGQRALWDQHNIPVEFAVSKHMLPEVKAKFEADVYYHIGDREDLGSAGPSSRHVDPACRHWFYANPRREQHDWQ